MTNLTVKDLRDFEEEIAAIYAEGKIRAPIHLRSQNETQLLEIFKNIREQDWCLGYWGFHLESLLKTVPKDELKEEILKGNSIALSFPKYKILCSGIVGSLNGVAVGLAWAIKQQKRDEHVYLFLGDMGATLGGFFESVRYAYNFELPLTFVVADNGVSVMTDTKKVWGEKKNIKWWENTKYAEKIIYYQYKNGWPHSGLGLSIKF